jgi:hypothetical protein
MDGDIKGSYSAQEMFKERELSPELNPFGVIRECVDSEEHPNTIPVILALDVTGSMGASAVEIAKKLNVIMTNLYENISDVEFMIMAIGDMVYDSAPLQVSQFESDVRIAEQLDKVYFEGGGGGNMYESYSAAWLFAARNTKLDCWKRGKKGIIITMGDEQLNPYLPKRALSEATGDTLQSDIETKDLFEEASKKFDIYHIDVDHSMRRDPDIDRTWKAYLDQDHYRSVRTSEVTDTIVEIILKAVGQLSDNVDFEIPVEPTGIQTNENGEIVW